MVQSQMVHPLLAAYSFQHFGRYLTNKCGQRFFEPMIYFVADLNGIVMVVVLVWYFSLGATSTGWRENGHFEPKQSFSIHSLNCFSSRSGGQSIAILMRIQTGTSRINAVRGSQSQWPFLWLIWMEWNWEGSTVSIVSRERVAVGLLIFQWEFRLELLKYVISELALLIRIYLCSIPINTTSHIFFINLTN